MVRVGPVVLAAMTAMAVPAAAEVLDATYRGTMVCDKLPFTSDKMLLVPALNPDVALIHVQRCDAYGNAQIDGLPFMDVDLAIAANKVILTTERIGMNGSPIAPARNRIPIARWLHSSNRALPVSTWCRMTLEMPHRMPWLNQLVIMRSQMPEP